MFLWEYPKYCEPAPPLTCSGVGSLPHRLSGAVADQTSLHRYSEARGQAAGRGFGESEDAAVQGGSLVSSFLDLLSNATGAPFTANS
jgi:hypothetical protein